MDVNNQVLVGLLHREVCLCMLGEHTPCVCLPNSSGEHISWHVNIWPAKNLCGCRFVFLHSLMTWRWRLAGLLTSPWRPGWRTEMWVWACQHVFSFHWTLSTLRQTNSYLYMFAMFSLPGEWIFSLVTLRLREPNSGVLWEETLGLRLNLASTQGVH